MVEFIRRATGLHYGEHAKDAFFTVTAVISAFFASLSQGVILLLILLAVDYLSGLVVAGVFHASPKTANGRLESAAGWKGLVRKFAILVMVFVCYELDLTFKTNSFIMSTAVIGFSMNELLSIIENLGLMGVPLPGRLVNAIEWLKQKYDSDSAVPAPAGSASVDLPAVVFPDDPDQEAEGTSGAEQAAEVTHHSGTF